MSALYPNHYCESVYQLEPSALEALGVRLLLADLDNTLAAYSDQAAAPRLRQWKDELEGRGIRLFLVSNSRKPGRAKRFADSLGIPWIGRAGKPSRKGFVRAMEEAGCGPEETAMVGDQIFTDILGGNRAGVTTILVRPVSLDNAFRRLRFRLETPFRRRGVPLGREGRL